MEETMNPNIRSIDGISQPRPANMPVVAPAGPRNNFRPRPQPTQSVQPRPVKRKTFAAPAPAKRTGMPDWVQLPLIITGGILAGLSIQSPVLGQATLVGYGIVAYILKIPSRTTFVLALLAMVATIIFLVFKGDVFMAQNFATYTFLLLVVGVITLNRELKGEGGRIYYSRRTR
jgi:hypothetical protein